MHRDNRNTKETDCNSPEETKHNMGLLKKKVDRYKMVIEYYKTGVRNGQTDVFHECGY